MDKVYEPRRSLNHCVYNSSNIRVEENPGGSCKRVDYYGTRMSQSLARVVKGKQS